MLLFCHSNKHNSVDSEGRNYNYASKKNVLRKHSYSRIITKEIKVMTALNLELVPSESTYSFNHH